MLKKGHKNSGFWFRHSAYIRTFILFTRHIHFSYLSQYCSASVRITESLKEFLVSASTSETYILITKRKKNERPRLKKIFSFKAALSNVIQFRFSLKAKIVCQNCLVDLTFKLINFRLIGRIRQLFVAFFKNLNFMRDLWLMTISWISDDWLLTYDQFLRSS